MNKYTNIIKKMVKVKQEAGMELDPPEFKELIGS